MPSFRIHKLRDILIYGSRILSAAKNRDVKQDVMYLDSASRILAWQRRLRATAQGPL